MRNCCHRIIVISVLVLHILSWASSASARSSESKAGLLFHNHHHPVVAFVCHQNDGWNTKMDSTSTSLLRRKRISTVISNDMEQSTASRSKSRLKFHHEGCDVVMMQNMMINIDGPIKLLSSSSTSSSLPLAADNVDPIILSSSSVPSLSPFVVAGLALVLGIAAQSFINQMLEGDQGLGAYLKDGSGYNKSGFRNINSRRNAVEDDTNSDPLPWLKLPKLDFVEVAGQQNDYNVVDDQQIQDELESLRKQMNVKLEQGNIDDAILIRQKLESMMDEAGIEYKADD